MEVADSGVQIQVAVSTTLIEIVDAGHGSSNEILYKKIEQYMVYDTLVYVNTMKLLV